MMRSVASEPPRQPEVVELVEVDVEDAVEKLGGPGVGQGLGELVAPLAVFVLQGAEGVDGVGPPLRSRPAIPRALERPGGLAGGAALAVSALALGACHRHRGHCTGVT